jgi:SLT domain-containing protein
MKAVANGLLAGLATGINGVSKGINWILGKVDAPKKLRIPYWTPPKFAKGTDGAPGGPSILGDGGKHEMFRTPQGHVGLSPATSTLYNLPAGTQILSGEKTAQLLGSLPHFANGAGSWISNAAGTIVNGAKTVGSKIKNAAVDVWSYMSDPSKLMDLVADKFSITKGLSDFPSGIVEGMFNKVKSGIGNFFSSMVGSFSGAGGSKAVNAWVQQALKISGAPSSWASALETIAMKESGGNPRAVNGWDSNAKAGHPSMGLMQTIQSTFNAHAKKGYSSILNPVDNIIAAIGYIKSRYGSVFNVPGIKSMAAGGAYKGYANGGVANTPQVASLAENSWPEYIISTQPSMRKRSLGLFNRLGQALGVSQSPDAANAQAQSSSYTPETSRTTVNRSSRSMEYHPEIHVTVKGDGDTTSNVKKAVKEALDDHYKELTGLYDPGVSY